MAIGLGAMVVALVGIIASDRLEDKYPATKADKQAIKPDVRVSVRDRL